MTLALVVISWLITIFTYAFRFAGCCTENKAVMQMIQVKGNKTTTVTVAKNRFVFHFAHESNLEKILDLIW